ncbi:hypothetical protein KCU81_g3379, partial [Aureobasidium melanogenum]|uniref:Uncharacterized protein n=1 Tax=Aureobasidium melanogenum (strain CBS 110374) TaxID=1043003 RepID=A0A074VRA0_AURM1
MSVITQAGMTPVGRSKRRALPQCVSACTHIRMDRIYGNWSCDTCRNPSPFGWLYHCTSDVPEVGDYAFIKSLTHPVSPAGEELRQLGLSESVIKEFEKGGYTDDQVQKLIRQKQHLQQVLERATKPLPSINHKAPEYTSTISDDVRCDFKVCQRCGPVRKERCWISFEAVFEDEVRPIDNFELTEGLPVKDARIAKTLGLCTPVKMVPSPVWGESPIGSPAHSASSGYTSDGFSTDDDFDDESCEDALSSVSHEGEAGLETRAEYEMPLVTLRDPRHAHAPRSTIRLVSDSASHRMRRTSTATNDDYDDSPSHSYTTTSSISLPTIPTTTSYTILPGCEETVEELRAQYSLKAMTDPECYSGHSFDFAPSVSSSSSVGSEVAVAGGFALTEEAMDNHTPDLFTRV